MDRETEWKRKTKIDKKVTGTDLRMNNNKYTQIDKGSYGEDSAFRRKTERQKKQSVRETEEKKNN